MLGGRTTINRCLLLIVDLQAEARVTGQRLFRIVSPCMGTLELHLGPLAGRVPWAEDDEGPPALVDAVHNLEGDKLTHAPVSIMDAAPGNIINRVIRQNWQQCSYEEGALAEVGTCMLAGSQCHFQADLEGAEQTPPDVLSTT